MPSLNSSAVNGLNLEGSVLALFAEFLAGFFDGGNHAIGANGAVKFPVAQLRSQEAPLPKTLDAAIGLSTVWVAPSSVYTYWDTLTQAEIAALPEGSEPAVRQQRACGHATILFLIRSSETGGDPNAQKQVQDGAGLLFGLLQNSLATEPLAQKGIHRLRPMPPRMAFPGDGAPSADLAYRLRILSCAVKLRWPLVSQQE
ncbi:MAG TPA: hypothetical protein VH413_16210 [Verrucomicrobiae bacterium]|jgi:hypothetical protein|nr:hypothetical protein [Verrucomicrobiae bacterium]